MCSIGMNGNLTIDTSRVNTFYVHPKYIESENSDYDMGIVRIEKPLVRPMDQCL